MKPLAQSEMNTLCTWMMSEQPSAFQSPIVTMDSDHSSLFAPTVKAAPKPFDSSGVARNRSLRSELLNDSTTMSANWSTEART